MRYAIACFITDRSIGPIELARAVEERGFATLFVPEHTHIPVARKTPYPAGEPLPDEYKRTLDPFVTLTAAAAVTTRLKVATGICLVGQRDPILCAKEVASLDFVSGGRFLFGVGYGWNQDELEDHGVAFRERRAVVRERMLAMERLWADDVASFAGAHVTLQPSWAWPKPVQRPRPTVMMGGKASPQLFEHIAEFADVWMPLPGAGSVSKSLPELREAFARAGRDPASARVFLYGAPADPAKLAHYRNVGVEEVTFFVPSAGASEVLPVLDRYAEIARSIG